MKSRTIFICGGGTGGHFFCGVAFAEMYLKHHPDTRIVFVGTKNGIEARTKLPDSRMCVRFVHSKGVKGKGLLGKIQGLLSMMVGFLDSIVMLASERPKLVLGVGGYASVPTLAAALFLKIIGRWKMAIIEQNSSPGLANRLFSWMPIKSFSAFPVPGFKTIDLPLRQAFLKRAESVRSPHWPPKTILIMGGSQGASGLNRQWSDLMIELHKNYPDIEILHQTGLRDKVEIEKKYLAAGIKAEVFAFSDDMPSYYERADLLVSRSGALTVFEAMALKRPATFVPFPAATDDHQTKNALAVQEREWVIPEAELNWQKFSTILKAPSPSVPQRRIPVYLNWDDLIQKSL